MAIEQNKNYTLTGSQIEDLAGRVNDAQENALDALEGLSNKVDKETGKGLSTNDFTNSDKTKLDSVEANAQENTIESVSVNGTEITPDADKNVDINVPAVENSLTSESTTDALSAAQGKTLKELIDNSGDIKMLTTADYNYNFRTHTTTNPNCVALWLLENGIYSVPVSGVVVTKWYSGQDETDKGLWLVAQGTDADSTAVVRLTHLSPNCIYDGTAGEYPIGPESVLVYKADGLYYKNQYSGESFLSWDQSKASNYSTSWASPKLGDIANLYDTLSQTYTNATAYVAGKAGLVPNSPVGTEYTLTSSGWKMAQSNYDQNDDTKKDYIKNRPFYETTTTETQSLIDGTAPSYAGAYDNGNTDPLCADVRSDLQTRGITNSGFFYDAITPATLTNIVNALQAEQTIHFKNIGGYAMSMEEEVRISATFVNSNTYTQLVGGVYAVNGTLNVNGTNYPSAVMYIGQSSQLDSDVQYSENFFSNMYPNGCFAIICANNVQYQFPESMMMIDSGWVWTIATEVEVSVLKQLDSKFIKVDGDTISVNSDGELEAQASGGGIKTLTTADYDWPTANPDGVAAWKLASGLYRGDGNTRIYIANNQSYYNVSLLSIPDTTDNQQKVGVIVGRYTSTGSNGQAYLLSFDTSGASVLGSMRPQDTLSSTFTTIPLSANQGRVLKDLIDSIAIRGAGAPTTSTVGTVGQLYEDGTNGALYQLKSIDITVTPNTYNWEEVGGGSGPTVVQTTGTSTTDVMSQNAVTTALGNVLVNGGTTVPTSSTEGQVGTQYNCVNNGEPEIYICTEVDTSTTPNTYTWKKVGLTLQLSTTDPGEGSPLADNTILGIYE